jgi:hypothetical protein
MPSISILQKRLDTLLKHMSARPGRSWAFVLLGDTDIAEEDRARILPGDQVYIKRIILNA